MIYLLRSKSMSLVLLSDFFLAKTTSTFSADLISSILFTPGGSSIFLVSRLNLKQGNQKPETKELDGFVVVTVLLGFLISLCAMH